MQDGIPGFDRMDWAERKRAAEQAWRATPGDAGARRRRKKRSPYVHLTHAERLRFLTQLAGLLCDFRDKHIIARAWSSQSVRNKPALGPWATCFLGVVNAFQSLLERVCTSHQQAGSRAASPMPGLLVHDAIAGKKADVLRGFMRIAERDARRSNRRHWIGPSPLCGDSKLTSMVQLADLCAVAVRQYLQNGDPTLFNVIEPGLEDVSHHPGGGECDCRICAKYDD